MGGSGVACSGSIAQRLCTRGVVIVPEASSLVPHPERIIPRTKKHEDWVPRGGECPLRRHTYTERTQGGGARHRAAERQKAQKSGREQGLLGLHLPIGSSSPPFHLTFPPSPFVAETQPRLHLGHPRRTCLGRALACPASRAEAVKSKAAHPRRQATLLSKICIDAAVTSEVVGAVARRRNQGTREENTKPPPQRRTRGGGSILCGEARNIAAMEMFDVMLGRSLPVKGRDPKGRTPLRGKCGSHPVKHEPRSHLWNFLPPGFHSSTPPIAPPMGAHLHLRFVALPSTSYAAGSTSLLLKVRGRSLESDTSGPGWLAPVCVTG